MRLTVSLCRDRITVALLLGVLAFSGCTRSPEAKSAAYIEAGKRQMKNNDAPHAILQFRNAAQATPKNPEAYYQLALAYLEVRDYAKAVASLRRTLELNPGHVAAQLRLAQLMSSVSDPERLKEAQGRLQSLLQGNPGNPEALHALALTELKLGEPDDAVQHLEQAMAAAPQEMLIAVTLAQARLGQKDAKGAEAVLRKACENAPKSSDALVILGRFYLSQNKPVEAELQFQRALALDPKHGPALLSVAILKNSIGRKQEAEQGFKQLSYSADKRFTSFYALFLYQEGRRDEALREFERVAAQDPSDRIARTRLIAVYQSANRPQDAQALLDKVLKKNPRDTEAILQRGEFFLQAGKYTEAEADLNRVLRAAPTEPEVHYVMAKLHQARGQALTYRQELSEALRLNPYLLPVRLELAQHFLAGNAKAALDLLNDAPESQKSSTAVLTQRNWALWILGDLPKMRAGIDQGLSRERSVDLLIQDGVWKLRAGDVSNARKSLEEALKLNPSNLMGLQALGQSYIAQKQPSMAVQKVKEYAVLQQKSAPVQEFLGVLLASNGDRAGARSALMAAKTADPRSVRADLALVQLDVVERKMDDARNRLGAVISGSGNSTARLWLGIIEEHRGNPSAAIEQLQKVVETDPDNAQALNNLAYLLAEHRKQLDEALKLSQKAVELAPGKSAYCDTLGWILYDKGLYPAAIQYLERAAASKEDPVWQYHLAMAYARGGDPARGRNVLDAALKINPNLPEAKIARQVVGASH